MCTVYGCRYVAVKHEMFARIRAYTVWSQRWTLHKGKSCLHRCVRARVCVCVCVCTIKAPVLLSEFSLSLLTMTVRNMLTVVVCVLVHVPAYYVAVGSYGESCVEACVHSCVYVDTFIASHLLVYTYIVIACLCQLSYVFTPRWTSVGDLKCV